MNINGNDLTSEKIVEDIKSQSSEYWEGIQEKNMLYLFQESAKNVPAYQDFLIKNGIDYHKVKSINDWGLIPPINKKNYLKQYPLKDLAWEGTLDKTLVFTATSGSTGEQTYFFRHTKLDWQYSVLLKSFLEKRSESKKNSPILVIDCFGMGVWIAGVITYRAFEIVSLENSYPISIITPGVKKEIILQALEKLAPNFDQIILAGYPPFIKDIIDEALQLGIPLEKYKPRLVFAAESITEEFRDYVAMKLNIENQYLDIMNIYGSADIGAMAVESTTSILIRKIIQASPDIFSSAFTSTNKTPTLAQYNPYFISFESMEDRVLLTGDSAMPMIKYEIGDHGGVINFAEMNKKLKKYDIDIHEEARNHEIEQYVDEQPFVYVYEREDMSVSLYGLNIYPEWIRRALLETQVSGLVTGKFAMVTRYNQNKDQYMEVNVELRKGVNETDVDKKTIINLIVKHLSSHSSEYTELYNNLRDQVLPKIVFWPAEDPTYFPSGNKQKWVIKDN